MPRHSFDVIEMDWRQYDAGAARFFGIDLLAEQSYAVTPYHFAGNNPIVFADPSGLKPIIPKDPAVPSGGGALGSYGNMMNGNFLDNIHNAFWATGMGYGPFVTGWGSGGNGSGDSPKGAMAFSSIDDMLSAIEQLKALNPDGFTLYNRGGNTFDAYSGVLLDEVFVTMGADGHFLNGDAFLANVMGQVATYSGGTFSTLTPVPIGPQISPATWNMLKEHMYAEFKATGRVGTFVDVGFKNGLARGALGWYREAGKKLTYKNGEWSGSKVVDGKNWIVAGAYGPGAASYTKDVETGEKTYSVGAFGIFGLELNSDGGGFIGIDVGQTFGIGIGYELGMKLGFSW